MWLGNSESSAELPASSAPRPLVSVVLLSYNRPAYLRAALASLLAQTYAPLEIIVVDNPSPASAEVARIVGEHTQIKLLRPPVNLGYAGGMNAGIEQAAGRFLYLTEDDIVLAENCLAQLVEYMNQHPATGLCAPIIYNRTARTIRCAGGEFELGAVYRKKVYGAGEADTGQFAQAFQVTYIDGAAILAETDLLRELGGFRAEYFMYVEAVELCARVIKRGRQLAVVPQAKVFHFELPEGPTPPELEFHKIKNFFSLYLLHAPLRHLPEFICRYALLNPLRSLMRRRGDTLILFRALLWVTSRAPSLLRERHKQARVHAAAVRTRYTDEPSFFA